MQLNFSKYSGTGNDFIIVDNRNNEVEQIKKDTWQRLCQRKNGIGADGVLILCASNNYDFKMRYLNADGGEVAMCGNGARCLSHYAYFEKKLKGKKSSDEFFFETENSIYSSKIEKGQVLLKMTEFFDEQAIDISDLSKNELSYYVNTGVPHCIFQRDNLLEMDLIKEALPIRHDSRFKSGVNINYFEKINESMIRLRTFERGVEGETLACGTGAVAAAIYCSKIFGIKNQITVVMEGGELPIKFSDDYKDIYLGGEVQKIFQGSIS